MAAHPTHSKGVRVPLAATREPTSLEGMQYQTPPRSRRLTDLCSEGWRFGFPKNKASNSSGTRLPMWYLAFLSAPHTLQATEEMEINPQSTEQKLSLLEPPSPPRPIEAPAYHELGSENLLDTLK